MTSFIKNRIRKNIASYLLVSLFACNSISYASVDTLRPISVHNSPNRPFVAKCKTASAGGDNSSAHRL